MEDCPATQPVEQDDVQATQLIGNMQLPIDPETELLEDVQATQLVATQLLEDGQATQLLEDGQETQLLETQLLEVDSTQLVATQLNDAEPTELVPTQLNELLDFVQATQRVDGLQTIGSPTNSEPEGCGIEQALSTVGEGARKTATSGQGADEERAQILVDAHIEFDVIGTQIDWRGGKATARFPAEETFAAATQVDEIASQLDEDRDDEIAAVATQVENAQVAAQAEGNGHEDQVGADEIATTQVNREEEVGGSKTLSQVEVNRDQVGEIATQVEGNRDDSSVATGSQRGTDKKTKNWASVCAESFRNSVLKAYERLKARNDARPDEPLESSAKLLLSWGDKQRLMSNPGVSTVGDDVAEVRETSFVDDSGRTSCSGASTPTPVTQPSGNLLAMWSNNKKSTTSRTSAGSPSKEVPSHESTLGKVKKVLFAGNEKDFDFAPRSQNIIVSTALREAGKELSYLNSQEPGEDSQRNALDAVDKFLFLSTTGSQSQGDIADAASFDMPAENDLRLATTMPQVLSHAEALKVEAAAAYAWMDSQGNPAPESPPPSDVPKAGQQDEKDMAALREPPEKPPETRSRVTSPRKNPMVTKRVFLTDQAKRGRKRGTSAATAEPATPEDIPAVKISSGCFNATTTRSNRKRKAFARATQDPDYVLANTRSARKRREEEQRQILTPDSQRRCKRRPVKILFSHSLDKEVVEQQKKIMKKLNLQSATNSSECTHFITDKFLRTVNMLEALAVGKPVVTAAWLENCRLAGCLLDEKNYILEDAKKEKEYGFCMRTTFSAAQHKLLFQGLTLYLTPKVKPPELRAITEAAGGQVLETFDCCNQDCLVVSCKEDYELCVPLLDKGITVYSAEFLLSGIVSYHLDFSKNQLFTDP